MMISSISSIVNSLQWNTITFNWQGSASFITGHRIAICKIFESESKGALKTLQGKERKKESRTGCDKIMTLI